MSAPGLRRIELLFWASLPMTITLILALFCLIPKHMVGLSYFMPPLVMIPMFFFGMLQPRDMSYLVMFALGLVMDAVQGLPLGFTSLGYIVFLILVSEQSKYIIKEGFVVKWGYFSLLLLAVNAVGWLLLSLLRSEFLPIIPVLIQCILTICFYPFFHSAFDRIYEQTKHRRWQIAHGR